MKPLSGSSVEIGVGPGVPKVRALDREGLGDPLGAVRPKVHPEIWKGRYMKWRAGLVRLKELHADIDLPGNGAVVLDLGADEDRGRIGCYAALLEEHARRAVVHGRDLDGIGHKQGHVAVQAAEEREIRRRGRNPQPPV